MIAERVRRTAAARRAIVVVFVLGVAGMATLAVSGMGTRPSRLWWVLFVVVMAAWFGARSASGDVAEGRADRLDERELLIRYRVTRSGFHALNGALLLLVTALIFLEDRFVLTGWMLFSLATAGASLPTMVLCWRTPEPDPED